MCGRHLRDALLHIQRQLLLPHHVRALKPVKPVQDLRGGQVGALPKHHLVRAQLGHGRHGGVDGVHHIRQALGPVVSLVQLAPLANALAQELGALHHHGEFAVEDVGAAAHHAHVGLELAHAVHHQGGHVGVRRAVQDEGRAELEEQLREVGRHQRGLLVGERVGPRELAEVVAHVQHGDVGAVRKVAEVHHVHVHPGEEPHRHDAALDGGVLDLVLPQRAGGAHGAEDVDRPLGDAVARVVHSLGGARLPTVPRGQVRVVECLVVVLHKADALLAAHVVQVVLVAVAAKVEMRAHPVPVLRTALA
mmetsp:Transcript_40841/g.102816  ORF Transcript_40841/g.102816 Transcript_40841/m.102816 type:complete len:306 (-) Transcript_40841:680-1597(-)